MNLGERLEGIRVQLLEISGKLDRSEEAILGLLVNDQQEAIAKLQEELRLSGAIKTSHRVLILTRKEHADLADFLARGKFPYPELVERIRTAPDGDAAKMLDQAGDMLSDLAADLGSVDWDEDDRETHAALEKFVADLREHWDPA